MADLLYKEWRLAVHPVVYMFSLIGALTLVPAYPYGMVFFFGCLGLFFTCQFARENADIFYTATLPVSKRAVVKSKCPVDGYTKRQYAKELLRQINKDHPGAKERMFHAILNGDIKGWPQRQIRTR